MAEKPRNGPGEPARSADGKVTGGSLRKASQLGNARGLSRYLRRQMKAKHGDARAHYGWLMEIAANKGEKTADRLKAIEQLANRMDGKPLQSVDLQVTTESGGNALAALPLADLLALARGKVPGGDDGASST